MTAQERSRQDPTRYYVEGHPSQGFSRLSEARSYAATRQRMGYPYSVRIYRAGKVDDLKRF